MPRVIDTGPEGARTIEQFASRGARSLKLGDGLGACHVYTLHFEPGGEIGPHEAGFDQLFLVVTGSGWGAGADGVRTPLACGQAAFFPRGQVHSKGSDEGMVAVMIQADELRSPCAEEP